MALSQLEFDYIRQFLHKQSAIHLDESKHYLAEARLDVLARQEGEASASALVTRLRNHPCEVLRRKVVDAMTTNETSFFRDSHPFESLRAHILPDLIHKRRAPRRLCIWSAACSSGQEPYSLAMLIRESFPELVTWDLEIIATDLSSEILARAARGRFTQMEVNRGVPAPLLIKYFRRDGLEWQIREDLRSMITFRQLNLIGPWTGLHKVDLIFMRNVLIYFDDATKKQIFKRLSTVIQPDGYLLLGGAETTLNLDATFRKRIADKCTFYGLEG